MRTTGKGLVLLLAAMLSISALFAVACGGGSGGLGGIAGGKATATASTNNGNESTSEATSEATSESDNSGGGSTVSKTANDYASKFCKAVGKYATDIQDLTNAETGAQDPAAMKDFIDQMVPLFNNLSNDLNKIKPPSDVKDWHNQVVTELSDAADIMSQMSAALDKPLDEAMTEITDLTSQMNDMQDPFSLSDLPDEYQTAFQENSDCTDLSDLSIFQ